MRLNRSERGRRTVVASNRGLALTSLTTTSKMITMITVLVLSPWIATSAAQGYPGGVLSVHADGALVRTSPTGRVTTIRSFAKAAPCLAMCDDNESIIVSQPDAFAPNRVLEFHPGTQTTRTLFESTRHAAFDFCHDQDGSLTFSGYTAEPNRLVFGLFKAENGTVRTLATAASLGVSPVCFCAGVTVNALTGNYLLVSGPDARPGERFAWDVANDGVVRTLGTVGDARYSHVQDRATGDLYVSGERAIYRLAAGANTHTTLVTGVGPFHALTMDRASLAGPTILARSGTHLFFVDVASRAITSVAVTTPGATALEAVFDRGRNVSTVRSGNKRWAIRVSFPGKPNTQYLLGVSASGTTPGVQLPGGRRIPLNVDALTPLTLEDRLPGVWSPGPCVTDANGEAFGFIDVARLPAINVPVHAVAFTVENGYFGEISDPVVLRLDR